MLPDQPFLAHVASGLSHPVLLDEHSVLISVQN